MITLLRLIAAGLLLSTSACATIVSDSSYPVVLNSEPTGAKIEITDKRGMTRFAGTTPATAQLDSGDGYFTKARYTVTMKKAIAALLSVTDRDVSIKGTTAEGMGFIGRGEGMAAKAVVLLRAVGSTARCTP